MGPTTTLPRLFGLTLMVALVLGSWPTDVSAQASGACVEGFSTVAATKRLQATDVLTKDATSALVAGTVRTSSGSWAARVARFDDSGWHTVVNRAFVGKETAFMAIGGDKGKGRWAVGFKRSDWRTLPFAQRQTSSGKWKGASVPLGGAHSVYLTDVSVRGKTNAWAVGYSLGVPGNHRPHAVRWNGRRWLNLSPSLGRGERGLLAAVSSTSSGGTWVAGSVTRSGVERPYIARRVDGKWKRMDLPQVGLGSITGIVVTSKTTGWAVGYRMDSGVARALVLRWNGKQWKRKTPPVLPEETLLLDVDFDAGAITLAGSTWDPGGGRMRPIVARRMGEGWQVRELKGFGADAVMSAIDGHKPERGFLVARGVDPTATALIRTCEGNGVSVATRQAARKERRAELTPPDDHTYHSPEALPSSRTGLAAAPQLKTVPTSKAPVLVVDRTAAAGLPTKGRTFGAVIRDFDGNGQKDIFLGRHYDPPALYLNDGGAFTEAPVEFSTGDRHGCAAADFDDSGLPDLYCTFGGVRGYGTKANELWLDPGGDDPRLAPDAGGARELLTRGRLAEAFDYDDDGHKDLVVGSLPNRTDGLPSYNRIYRWVGPGQFKLVPNSGISAAVGARSVDSADFDRDGRMDLLLVTNDPMGRGPKTSLRLYRNTKSGLRDVHASRGIKSIGEVDAELAGLDGDARFDLIQLSKDRLRISLQRNGKFVKVYERKLTKGRAIAVGDADGDGDTDIYILRRKTDGDVKDLVLFNNGNGRSYTAIKMPTRSGGSNDQVLAIDHDGNGMTDFLVLDGRSYAPGPIHLIAFYPR